MKIAPLLAVCALCAACSSPVQSLIYASAGKPYTPNPAFAKEPKLFAERRVTRPDGQKRQYFWYETANTTHTIIYLHGNGELAEGTARTNLLSDLGGDTAILEYTGYGPNSGTPTEAELMADARALIAALKREKPRQKIILVGFSIGGSLAALLAAEGGIDGLVTVAAFTTLRDVAPAIGRPLIGADNVYDARAAASKITVPWVLLHCDDDPIIPARMGRSLSQAPKSGPALRVLRPSPCDTHFVPITQWRPAIEAVKAAL